MVIYAIYRLAVLPVVAPSASAYSSPSPLPNPGLTLGLWKFVLGTIAALVTAGHAVSWIMVWWLNFINLDKRYAVVM